MYAPMWVCMHLGMCVFIYVKMCVCISMYLYMYVCLYVYIYVYVFVCMYISICVYVCLYVCRFVCLYLYMCVYVCVEGVSRLVDITAAGDFACVLIKKFNTNVCPMLDGYGVMVILLFPYTPSCEPRYGTSWWVMYSTWWLIICVASTIFAT